MKNIIEGLIVDDSSVKVTIYNEELETVVAQAVFMSAPPSFIRTSLKTMGVDISADKEFEEALKNYKNYRED